MAQCAINSSTVYPLFAFFGTGQIYSLIYMSRYFDSKELFMEPKVNQYGGHMVMTGVQKPSQRKYINIDTRFCDDYNYNNTNAVYTITLPQRINEVKSIMICNLELPMSIYNISSNLGNNTILLDGSAIVIPDGFYTATSTSTFINQINTVLQGTDLSYNIQNAHSVFTNHSASPHTLQFDVNSNGVDKYQYKSKLGWFLGYHSQAGTYNKVYQLGATGSGTNSLTANSLINFNGPRYLYLVIDEFSNGNQNSFWAPINNYIINKNIIARISMDFMGYPYGTVMTTNNFNGLLLSDRRSYNGKVDLQKLAIQLIDEYGTPVDLNGLDFSFCMEVEYE